MGGKVALFKVFEHFFKDFPNKILGVFFALFFDFFWIFLCEEIRSVTIFPNNANYNGKMSQNSWGQDIQRMLGTQKLLGTRYSKNVG